MKKKLFIFLVLAPMLGIGAAFTRIYYHLNMREYKGEDQVFSVKSGEGFSSINYRLKKAELIGNSQIFYRYSRFAGIMENFKAGDYLIPQGSRMIDIIEKLTSGKGITISTTVPEGKNLFEIGKILEKAKICTEKDFIAAAKNPLLMKRIGIPADRAEGYLYPDTYFFSATMTAEDVIESMYRTFKRKTKSINFSHPKLSKHEIVILASIVEKETGAAFERPKIAGVFHNRLKKRMRLQSDPTTIYGIFETYKGNLRKKHLRQKTAYNTYKIPALPKGPISNPGIESINAVLNPEKHNFFYFVSQNDGTHIFSETYSAHRKAVNKWQKNRANRKGKSWRDLKQ